MKIDPANLNKHDAHELFMSALVPRPIALVSTVGEDGVYNLAPFSCVTFLCLNPPLLALNIGWKRDGGRKHTLRNIETGGDFVVNMVDEPMAAPMDQSAGDFPGDVDEFKEVGLTPLAAERIKSPLVAESPVRLECRLKHVLTFGECPTGSSVVIGEVLLVHVRDDLWAGDHISGLRAVARLGQDLYCRIADCFEMKGLKL